MMSRRTRSSMLPASPFTPFKNVQESAPRPRRSSRNAVSGDDSSLLVEAPPQTNSSRTSRKSGSVKRARTTTSSTTVTVETRTEEDYVGQTSSSTPVHRSTSARMSISSASISVSSSKRDSNRSSSVSGVHTSTSLSTPSNAYSTRSTRSPQVHGDTTPEPATLSDDIASHTRSHDGIQSSPVESNLSVDYGDNQNGDQDFSFSSSSNSSGSTDTSSSTAGDAGCDNIVDDDSGDTLLWGNIALLIVVLIILLFAIFQHPWLHLQSLVSSDRVTALPSSVKYTSTSTILTSGTHMQSDDHVLAKFSGVYAHRLALHERLVDKSSLNDVDKEKPESQSLPLDVKQIDEMRLMDMDTIGIESNSNVDTDSCDRLVKLGGGCTAKLNDNSAILLELLHRMQSYGDGATAQTDLYLSGRLLQEILGECLLVGENETVVAADHSMEVLKLLLSCEDTSPVLKALLTEVHSRIDFIIPTDTVSVLEI